MEVDRKDRFLQTLHWEARKAQHVGLRIEHPKWLSRCKKSKKWPKITDINITPIILFNAFIHPDL